MLARVRRSERSDWSLEHRRAMAMVKEWQIFPKTQTKFNLGADIVFAYEYLCCFTTRIEPVVPVVHQTSN